MVKIGEQFHGPIEQKNESVESIGK